MAKYIVGRASELPDGERQIVTVRGRSIGIFNVDGEFYALRNSCPHEGGPVCEGLVVGALESQGPRHYSYDPGQRFVQCPWHGWEYDIRTGQSWYSPTTDATRRYDVGRESGKAIVQALKEHQDSVSEPRQKGPYVAESYEVSVEEDYLVITM